MILTVIIAIPNTSDDVTIPTAIPTPSPINAIIEESTVHGICISYRGIPSKYSFEPVTSPSEAQKDVQSYYMPNSKINVVTR